jgi:ribonuclease HI
VKAEPIQQPRANVTIYTDGACQGNPGRGGYGVILESGAHRRELSAGYRLTTNNRMEIMAVIAGLEALRRPSTVTLYTDSQYLVNALRQGWARRWRKNGWKRANGEPAINADLWARLLDLCERHDVKVEWVRGHAGHPENERCDRLSVSAASGANLLEDTGYTAPGA